MKIKKIKSLTVNAITFTVNWDKKTSGASFNYAEKVLNIGVGTKETPYIFMLICHELMEMVALECHVRLQRPDVSDDYVFVYDHRQHDTMMAMFSGLLSQFIE